MTCALAMPEIIRYQGEAAPLLHIWRQAVLATHDFLNPQDIDFYESVARNALPHLEIWSDSQQRGFVALDKQMVDMLFVAPEYHRQGVGFALLNHVRQLKGTLKVYVNQQNSGALHFYQRFGFQEVKRLPVDGSGRPYPLILLTCV